MRHSDVNLLKDIAKICEAQRVRAELEVERLNIELDRLARRRDTENRGLEAAESGWRRAVTGASLQLTASAAWSAEVVRARMKLAETEDDMRSRRRAREVAGETLRAASARGEAVEALTERTARLAARRREDAAMENHPVRTAPGWRASCV